MNFNLFNLRALRVLCGSRIVLCAFAPLRAILLAFTFFIPLFFANSAPAANWDRFRGPNGAGQSDDAGIPTKWEPENFLWKQSLNNIGHSSPVIWGNRLFLTSGDVKTGAQIVSAFDIRNGAPLWEQKLDAGTYHMNSLNSYASSTPAVDADHIYLLWLKDGQITLAALTHDGKEVWRHDIGPFKE